MIMTTMERFKAVHGKNLEVSDRVTVTEESEYYSEWRGEYVVIGIEWERERDIYNVCIAELAT